MLRRKKLISNPLFKKPAKADDISSVKNAQKKPVIHQIEEKKSKARSPSGKKSKDDPIILDTIIQI